LLKKQTSPSTILASTLHIPQVNALKHIVVAVTEPSGTTQLRHTDKEAYTSSTKESKLTGLGNLAYGGQVAGDLVGDGTGRSKSLVLDYIVYAKKFIRDTFTGIKVTLLCETDETKTNISLCHSKTIIQTVTFKPRRILYLSETIIWDS